ncbi:hypothetical protein [Enterococcus sp. SMC-9]|uniref:hypothetical protein n=1 Tax=Enterococcus sp. SMC-9 TaxID=2862343 RepID=UPI001E3BB155|nr:hypothetical protein [Enterococcus sp. SMC-9]MCD1025472.1 hypothetical protein [Enterococcus sp. SMC-9]
MKRMRYAAMLSATLLSLTFLVGCNTHEKQSMSKISSDTTTATKKEDTSDSSETLESSSATSLKTSTSDSLEFTSETEKDIQSVNVKEILSTDNVQKYVDAYNEFTMQGNPFPPTQRGLTVSNEIYSASGLEGTEYGDRFWGIIDYYGNAVEQGWISQEQASQAKKEAINKLQSGAYALHSKNETQQVTAENAAQYAEKFNQETLGWALQYMQTIQDSEENFQVYFISQDPTEKAKKGYFLVTKDRMVSRYSNGGGVLSDPIEVTLP